jgi:hypothetical protein
MSTRQRIKPRDPSMTIRDPKTRRALPADGAEVKLTSFWVRRLRDGDVVPAPALAPKKAAPKKAAD